MTTFATVSNYAGSDFSPKVAHAILTSPAYTRAFIDGMLAKLKLGQYAGLNIDFESITASDRAAYTAFVQTVAQKMKAAGYLTMVSVPAKQVDEPSNSWDGAFDYKALGAAADVLQVMTYDENGPWGKPGAGGRAGLGGAVHQVRGVEGAAGEDQYGHPGVWV